MRRLFTAALLFLACFAAVPQQKNRFCLDAAVGVPLGFSRLKGGSGFGGESEARLLEAGAQFSLKTYDFFFLDGMLGVYAGVGFNAAALKVGYGGTLTDIYFETAFDFCVGPAFGMDIGNVRLQAGLGFYALFAKGRNTIEYNGNYASQAVDVSHTETIKYSAFGFALTPQARFSPNSRLSFVAGVDISFAFPRKLKVDYRSDFAFIYQDRYAESLAYTYGKGMRFGITPYVALGVNFGKIKKAAAEKAEEKAEAEGQAEIESGEPTEGDEQPPLWMPPVNFNIKR